MTTILLKIIAGMFLKQLIRIRPSISKAIPASAFAARYNNTKAKPHPAESFLSGASTVYMEQAYQQWRQNPESVHSSWGLYFENLDKGLGPGNAYTPPPFVSHTGGVTAAPIAGQVGSIADKAITDALKVGMLIRAYQRNGHSLANLDPLGIPHSAFTHIPVELHFSHYGFSDGDLDRTFVVNDQALFPEGKVTLRTVVDRLKATYSASIGYEYTHMMLKEHTSWWRDRIEVQTPYTGEEKKSILKGLSESAGFEKFLYVKFGGEKRFGIEGAEALIPGMQRMVNRAAKKHGVTNMVIGMPHRGRLNVLHNVMNKKLEILFKEFESPLADLTAEGSGDVKYHLGTASTFKVSDTHAIHVALLANPSHLEAVNPVVEGYAAAQQYYAGDTEKKSVVPVLLHGDAAFSGQGVVFETFGFNSLEHYKSGGTIHVVVNNQVGFTTNPIDSRSSQYCSDVAKAFGAPILHVNADDTEAVMRCFDLAIDWRQTFGRDVVIDLVGYRRNGHNETDNPMFTQPQMYSAIAQHPTVLTLYQQQLLKEGIVTAEEAKAFEKAYENQCHEAFDRRQKFIEPFKGDLDFHWTGFKKYYHREGALKVMSTGISPELLRELGQKLVTVPQGFNVHPLVQKFINDRQKSLADGVLDWATAEALSFASLLSEGVHVRLSGQDVERGTFSQRHHVLHDQKEFGKSFNSMSGVGKPGQYIVSNSHLSEYGVLGFELGYSMVSPNSLVCWEAQFGDFVNTAQCITDQFISAGEQKWGTQSGLVLLLPHGYEGMGPEHSSARLERFLQQCDDDEDVYPEMSKFARKQIQTGNWQVVNMTTPANYFHILRRQVHRAFRKPLIVMSPKSLLRHPFAKSHLSELEGDTRFHRLIPEIDQTIFNESKSPVNTDVKRLIFCSGKVYFDLVAAREKAGLKDIAIARVEQISPFPFDLVHRHADNFPNAEIIWAQEEPKNQGAWSYVRPRIVTALSKSSTHAGKGPAYAGRIASASTATGNKNNHKEEQYALVKAALGLTATH